ncbi:cytochrome c oxidase subunit 3, partial [bacterium]|nr:cytochrome c oxidase subunit 3 [bacterium]
SAGANATIFYCLTWIHALHVLGGLVILGVCLANAWRGRYTLDAHLGVELCELYWHFLLAVWLVLVVMLFFML